jgi:hypothetical protein
MKLYTQLVCAVGLLSFTPAFGQKWEMGGAAGVGFYTSNEVSGAGANASAKIAPGVAGSAWITNDNGRVWAGEVRYDYQLGDLKLSSGATTAAFAAQTHAVHYDFQYHFAPREDTVRPFLLFGGGAKVYQGTGDEVAYQPLHDVALLTKTTDVRPLVNVGFGIKANRGGRLGFRLEFRDCLTPFPDKIIAPAQNSTVGGWVHDFVTTFGISVLL